MSQLYFFLADDAVGVIRIGCVWVGLTDFLKISFKFRKIIQILRFCLDEYLKTGVYLRGF
jgi:hypothetical protein